MACLVGIHSEIPVDKPEAKARLRLTQTVSHGPVARYSPRGWRSPPKWKQIISSAESTGCARAVYQPWEQWALPAPQRPAELLCTYARLFGFPCAAAHFTLNSTSGSRLGQAALGSQPSAPAEKEKGMTKLYSFLQRLARDERGQDMVEYALLAGFIAVAAGALLPGIAVDISIIFSKMASIVANAALQ